MTPTITKLHPQSLENNPIYLKHFYFMFQNQIFTNSISKLYNVTLWELLDSRKKIIIMKWTLFISSEIDKIVFFQAGYRPSTN